VTPGVAWTIQRPIHDGYYWIRNAHVDGWEDQIEPCIVSVYGFADGVPTVTFALEQEGSDLSAVDAEWAGPVEPPP
jgi:hypothetical protein